MIANGFFYHCQIIIVAYACVRVCLHVCALQTRTVSILGLKIDQSFASTKQNDIFKLLRYLNLKNVNITIVNHSEFAKFKNIFEHI